MNKICVRTIDVTDSIVTVNFGVDECLKKYFKEFQLTIEYKVNNASLDLKQVPEGILVIPFVSNVLPIVWLTDSVLQLSTLDADFYNCINEVKQGYRDMYPDCDFKGSLVIPNITAYDHVDERKSATLFSGGVDAYCTLVRHIDENPDLMLLWGADIPYANQKSWDILYNSLSKEINKLKLSLITIHSSFRCMVNEATLTNDFEPMLHDGWWHGIQHGLGLIGHTAPCNYLRGISTQYIAASYWPGAKLTCASWPTIDNNVRFFGCHVVHDAFIPRQDKIKIIAESHQQKNMPVNLHVCWENISGKNCCVCEKCCRTIMGLLAEGEDPCAYGFDVSSHDIKKAIRLCTKKFYYDFIAIPFWQQIKDRVMENSNLLREKNLYQYVRWMESFDFTSTKQHHPNVFIIILRKIKRKLSGYAKRATYGQ